MKKAQEIEEKLSILSTEIASIQKNIIIYPNENHYKNLHITKTKELNSLYNELEEKKGKTYLYEFIQKLSNKYNESEYVLSKTEQKILDKILIKYKAKIKAFKKAKGNKREAQALYAEHRTEELERINYSKNNNGGMSLAKMFWLYFIFIGIILSAIGGYFHALGYPIIIIIPIAYYAYVSVALWNCATLYQNEKLANRQSYGWAIVVKILIVFNIVMIAIQIWLNFMTK